MNHFVDLPKHRKLAGILDAISIIESRLSAGPGDPLPPPSEREATALKAEMAGLVDTLPDHHLEVEALRRKTHSRLQREACHRLFRAAGGRTIDRLAEQLDATGEPLRLDHKTACGETVTISLSPTMTLATDAIPCRSGDEKQVYLRVVAPSFVCRSVTDLEDGASALDLIRLLETITIAP